MSTPDAGRFGSEGRARVERTEERIRSAYRIAELAVRESTVLLDHSGTVVDSIRLHERLGIAIDELVGGGPVPAGWSITHLDGTMIEHDDHPALVAMRTGEQTDAVVRYHPPHGSSIALRFLSYPVRDDDEIAIDSFVTDHERRQLDREALEAMESRFRTMADMLPVAVWESTPGGQITYVNAKFTEMTGRELHDTPDLPMFEVVHPDDLLAVMESASKAVDKDRFHTQYRLLHLDGSSRWVTARLSIIVDETGKMNGFAGAIEDIDDLWRSERRSAQLADIVETAGEMIAVLEHGVMTYVNRAGKLLFEKTDPAYVLDQSTHTFFGQFLERYAVDAAAALTETGVWSSDVTLFDVDGEPVHLATTVRAELAEGEVVRSVMMARDIGEWKRHESRLAHDAVHDPLTGLSNRHGLERVVAALAGDVEVDVLFVDVDHFKAVNDTDGHAVGDAVLVAIANRVRSVVGNGGVIARVGGDEMLIVRPAGDGPAADLAARLVEAVGATPVVWNDRSWSVTVTIGVASGAVGDLEELTLAADRALYRAKASGRNRWECSAD